MQAPPNSPPVVLNAEPLIISQNSFITPEECNHFIEIAIQQGMKPALLVGSKTGVDVATSERTNSSCWIQHNHTEVTQAVVNRICALVNMPANNAEQIQLIYYRPNQYYQAHFDGWEMPDDPTQRTEEQRIIKARYMDCMGGQRLATCLVYLNELTPAQGGRTHFPNLAPPPQGSGANANSFCVHPERGKIVCFSNVYHGTNKLHPLSLHAGTNVLQAHPEQCISPSTGEVLPCEKWAFNLWFREKSANR